jgi:hypothetical protein
MVSGRETFGDSFIPIKPFINKTPTISIAAPETNLKAVLTKGDIDTLLKFTSRL